MPCAGPDRHGVHALCCTAALNRALAASSMFCRDRRCCALCCILAARVDAGRHFGMGGLFGRYRAWQAADDPAAGPVDWRKTGPVFPAWALLTSGRHVLLPWLYPPECGAGTQFCADGHVMLYDMILRVVGQGRPVPRRLPTACPAALLPPAWPDRAATCPRQPPRSQIEPPSI